VTSVYRAPLRSRRDDIDPALTFERALSLGLCGFGDHGDTERLERRVQRFAAAPDGSLVWTRGPEGMYWLGRLAGSYFYDAAGESVDLVDESRCPAAVAATFGRGGRNFQQIHDSRVGEESMRLWGG
jgi:hypothetical protein